MNRISKKSAAASGNFAKSAHSKRNESKRNQSKGNESKEESAKEENAIAKPVKRQRSEKAIIADIEAVMVLERGQVKPEQLCKALSVSNKEIESHVSLFNKQKLAEESPLRLVEFNGNLELTIADGYDSQAVDHYRKKKRKLSEQSLETVTIVAYKQPVTKAEIDKIRGANSTTAIKVLLAEKLIETVGNKHAPGKPALFATTRRFLRHFSLKSLDELTPLKEVKNYPFLEDEQKPLVGKKADDKSSDKKSL